MNTLAVHDGVSFSKACQWCVLDHCRAEKYHAAEYLVDIIKVMKDYINPYYIASTTVICS
ncbi:hypothetical protein RO3G_06797 [Rhizopus delemar RA 99-880]|uniref:Uncharacterized protein n=1 Tax=Rhizopus delemar (strain RA 99-880 / ATCC MYA-4621 / FGSC 9543 / NRRL 43880) TaxID=246409 RepID=I1C0W2_RHIO9|nr:hypothetical protein RO3G_06797 [Rhizopus delemar RA 99-880]|eukprot:EIE82092.1 hypothetical protein RO3G_06797 [Rhizopus delemar RA 99-880]